MTDQQLTGVNCHSTQQQSAHFVAVWWEKPFRSGLFPVARALKIFLYHFLKRFFGQRFILKFFYHWISFCFDSIIWI